METSEYVEIIKQMNFALISPNVEKKTVAIQRAMRAIQELQATAMTYREAFNDLVSLYSGHETLNNQTEGTSENEHERK